MRFSEFLRQDRIEKGFPTQQALSWAAHIPINRISDWELGHSTPNLRYINTLAEVLGWELPWPTDDRVGAKRRYHRSLASSAA